MIANALVALLVATTVSPFPAQDPARAQDPESGQDVPLPAEMTVGPSRDAVRAAAIARLDGMVGIAGSEVVLQADLMLIILQTPALRERYEQALADQRAYERLMSEALEVRLRDLLTVEAGRTLGFDPALVSDYTKATFAEDVERFGGHRAFSDLLRQNYLTPQDWRNQIEDRLLGEAWRASVSGRAAGPTGRPSVDRFISPAWLEAAYEDLLRSRSPEERALVGIQPERVIMRQLVIDETEGNDARALAQALRAQAETEGADFEGLIRRYGSAFRDEGGRTDPFSLDLVREVSRALHDSGELHEFAKTAAVGDYLGPLLATSEGGTRGWWVYRLEERLPATEALPFTDPDMQRRLLARVQRRLDDLREQTAFRAFLKRTYVHPPELEEFLERSGGRSGR